jgi:Zn-dependent peptidase ImmA (M78 family)
MKSNGFAPVDINPHLVRDLQTRLRTTDLLEWIEAQAEKLASSCSSEGHIEFTPEIYRSRRIRDVFPEQLVGAASIKPATGDQYDIFYNPFYKNRNPLRWRFAIAHELGHTYWFAPGGGGKPLSPVQWKLGRDPGIEYLCNRFAAALLMPRQRLTRFVTQIAGCVDVPLHVVPAASAAYKVPDRAVARRVFFEHLPMKVAIVCLKKTQPKVSLQSKPLSDCWKTDWSVFSASSSSQALGTKGFRIPLSRNGRIIPNDMIPEVPYGGTHLLSLDGRWWDLLQMKTDSEARTWFSRLSSASPKVGYASRAGQKLYLALPLDRA